MPNALGNRPARLNAACKDPGDAYLSAWIPQEHQTENYLHILIPVRLSESFVL
jgi:hypothetical protein